MRILRNQLEAVAGVLELVGLELGGETEAEKGEGSAVGKSGRRK